jgi:predicted transcriptional regulator
MTTAIQYDGAITIRANSDVIAAIHAAARKRDTKPSQWIRDALNLVLSIERGDAPVESES